MTTNRTPWRAELPHLVPLAWPVALSLLSYALMTLVDTLFVSRLGAPTLAGVGLAGVAYFTLIAFPAGALRAAKTVVAQRMGAGLDPEPAARAAVVLGLGLAAVFAAVCLGLSPHLPKLLHSVEAGDAAVGYLSIRAFGIPFDCVFMALREYRYGTSDTRSPMRASLLSNALNIGLDALFVPGLGWGAEGAAAATAVAAAVQALLLFGPNRTALRSKAKGLLTAIARLGTPSGLQFLIETGAFLALTLILAEHSDRAVAAHQIALQLVHFGFLPAVAVGEAASVRAGEAVGGGRLRRVFAVAGAGTFLVWLWAFTVGVVFVVFAGPLTRLFGSDVNLLADAEQLLWIAAVFLIPDGAQIVFRGVLRGTGDVRWPAVLMVVGAWVITPPLSAWWALHLGYGARGAWAALTVEILVAAAVLLARLWSGRWVPAARTARRWATASPEG